MIGEGGLVMCRPSIGTTGPEGNNDRSGANSGVCCVLCGVVPVVIGLVVTVIIVITAVTVAELTCVV